MNYWKKLVRLFTGIILFGLGISMFIRANIGYPSWDVLHSGISTTFGIPIGVANQIVAIIILVIVLMFGEKIGVGTIVNSIFIGIFIDIFMAYIPIASNVFIGIIMFSFSFFIIAFASFLYLSAGLGAGPRDSLMVLIEKKTKLKTGICRFIVEVSATVLGVIFGGFLGFGTVFAVFGISWAIQIVFSLMNFSPAKIEHESILVTAKNIFASKTV